jgi:hypothetical protein
MYGNVEALLLYGCACGVARRSRKDSRMKLGADAGGVEVWGRGAVTMKIPRCAIRSCSAHLKKLHFVTYSAFTRAVAE